MVNLFGEAPGPSTILTSLLEVSEYHNTEYTDYIEPGHGIYSLAFSHCFLRSF